jgi:WD40 repeat protein
VEVLKFGNVAGTFASAGSRLVHVWDVTSGTQLWGFNIPNQCLSLEFADQDRLLLGALGNSCVTIWDMATGIVREIAGWTEDLSLFSPGRVISLHFDNSSDTLISLDDSNRVMIHHCTDFAGTSEELKPSFD